MVKLKEKLAEEYHLQFGISPYDETELSQAYLAGFDKAKELGIEIIECESHSPPCINNFIYCEAACEGVIKMKNLGEEEV